MVCAAVLVLSHSTNTSCRIGAVKRMLTVVVAHAPADEATWAHIHVSLRAWRDPSSRSSFPSSCETVPNALENLYTAQTGRCKQHSPTVSDALHVSDSPSWPRVVVRLVQRAVKWAEEELEADWSDNECGNHSPGAPVTITRATYSELIAAVASNATRYARQSTRGPSKAEVLALVWTRLREAAGRIITIRKQQGSALELEWSRLGAGRTSLLAREPGSPTGAAWLRYRRFVLMWTNKRYENSLAAHLP
jgi:hypothetical protein